MVHKMFNARSKEAMHSFLERNCGRFGKKNSMAIRVTLKAISGSNSNNQGERKTQAQVRDQRHEEDSCDHDSLDPQLGDLMLSLEEDDGLSEDEEVVLTESAAVVSTESIVKRPRVTKKDQQKINRQAQVSDMLIESVPSIVRGLDFDDQE